MGQQTLDLKEFLDRVQDDKELVLELLDIFTNDFAIKRREFASAFDNNDAAAVEHIAHFLKGSCGNISAGDLRQVFYELEEKGRRRDLSDKDRYLADIDRKYAELLADIEDIRVKLR